MIRICATALPKHGFRRPFSAATGKIPAIAFDIDGVIIRGHDVIKAAIPALTRITPKEDGGTSDRPIPYVFLTNGGGVMERTKADQLSKWLGLKVRPEQVVLSHSPMQALVPTHRDHLVMAIGRHDVKHVALQYGFRHVTTPAELSAQFPLLVPHATDGESKVTIESQTVQRAAGKTRVQSGQSHSHSKSTLTSRSAANSKLDPHGGVRALMVFSDPLSWYRDLQVAMDVLAGWIHPPQLGPDSQARFPQQLPMYFSNPDFIFSGTHAAPRLAQGAFRVALEALYKELTGKALQCTMFGKPSPATYRFAETLLRNRAKQLGYDDIGDFYGIGDNPQSDIRGANQAGPHWTSVLVRSGTIQATRNPLDAPKYSFDDVHSAVDFIEKQRGNRT